MKETKHTQETKEEKIRVPNRELRCVVRRVFELNNEAELDLIYNLANSIKHFEGTYIEIYNELVETIRETIVEFINEKMIYADRAVKKNIGDIIMGIVTADYDSLTSVAKIIYIFTKDDMAEVKEDEYKEILNALNSD